ncbi:MAG TPA: hypothetical protein VGN63_10810 [Flavisolibacter sp.]|jgi:hypothetical protein|nr:hypothetical protein [Flavisolibacter sp.]
MNQFFSFNRFTLLVVKHWAENKRQYGLAVLALIGVLIVRFLFNMLLADEAPMSAGVQLGTYLFLLFVVGTFYASQYFSDMGSRAKGSNFLLVPASIFEKFLCSLLYTVILFIVVFTAVFYAVNILMLALSNEILGTDEHAGRATISNVMKASFFMFRSNLAIHYLFCFFTIQSAFLLGSIGFKNHHYLKTVLSVFVVGFLLFSIIYLIYKPLFPGDRSLISIPVWVEQAFRLLVMYVIAPSLWIMTYYSLKQKQV